MLCVGEKLDKSSSMLMGFFFLPPIHLSQQLSFILISFYLNLQNRAWDNKEAESLNNQAPCSAGAGDLETQRAVGKVARALLGVCGCRNCPQGSGDESPRAVSIRKAPRWQPQVELCCCICVAHPGLDIWDSLWLLLLITLGCERPLRALGLLQFSYSPCLCFSAVLEIS